MAGKGCSTLVLARKLAESLSLAASGGSQAALWLGRIKEFPQQLNFFCIGNDLHRNTEWEAWEVCFFSLALSQEVSTEPACLLLLGRKQGSLGQLRLPSASHISESTNSHLTKWQLLLSPGGWDLAPCQLEEVNVEKFGLLILIQFSKVAQFLTAILLELHFQGLLAFDHAIFLLIQLLQRMGSAPKVLWIYFEQLL